MKQRMTHKLPMKLLSPKACAEIGQRPQHTWQRTRMVELERKHLTRNEAKGTAQNRIRWCILVEDLCSICF